MVWNQLQLIVYLMLFYILKWNKKPWCLHDWYITTPFPSSSKLSFQWSENSLWFKDKSKKWTEQFFSLINTSHVMDRKKNGTRNKMINNLTLYSFTVQINPYQKKRKKYSILIDWKLFFNFSFKGKWLN